MVMRNFESLWLLWALLHLPLQVFTLCTHPSMFFLLVQAGMARWRGFRLYGSIANCMLRLAGGIILREPMASMDEALPAAARHAPGYPPSAADTLPVESQRFGCITIA